jgi:hypothetical protein
MTSKNAIVNQHNSSSTQYCGTEMQFNTEVKDNAKPYEVA